MLFLGLDAGGTSTRATLVSSDGTCMGYGRSGGGNPISSGPELAASGVLTAVDAALSAAGSTAAHVSVIVAAMAGNSAHGPRDWLLDPLAERGFTGRLAFHSDLLATYFSGAFSSAGYAMVSGTGAAVIRVEGGDVAATADGLGWLLGDAGSGFWIGHQVALAAVSDLDARGPHTKLTALLLDELGIRSEGPPEQGRPASLGAVINALYGLRPVELARFAPLAFRARGDVAADTILQDAADHLAHSVGAVVEPAVPGPLVMGGSILAQPGPLADRLRQRLAAAGFEPKIARVSDGAVGAAVLALREGGITVDENVFSTVTRTIDGFR